MKNKFVLVAGAMALAAMVGCNGSSNSNVGGSPDAERAVASAPAERTDVVLGTPASNWDVVARAYSVDGNAVEHTDDAMFAGYPLLAARVTEASVSTRVIATQEHTLEFYDKDTLVMIVSDAEGAAPAVTWTRSGFMADKIDIAWNMADDKKGTSVGSVKFDLSECKAKEPDQGQGKEPDQGQGGKGGQSLIAGEPDQGQGKEPEKAPVCKLASVTLSLQEISKPDQGQDQGQGKAPDQGQGKAPDQGQGKPAPAPTPDPDQGQGKPAPTPAPTPDPDQGQGDKGQGGKNG